MSVFDDKPITATPFTSSDYAVDASPAVRKALQDMATRDQFALAYARAAMGRPRDDLWPMVAEEAYKFADAMMKARAK